MMQPQPVPMGPPMGGPLGPPPPQPVQMPMGPQAGPQQVQGQQGQKVTQPTGYGGSARGRAGFKQYLRGRKQQTQQKAMFPQQAMGAQPAMPAQMMGPQPMQPPMMSMQQQGPLVGRQVPGGPMVGSAPVQMMGGGVVPLFSGLGRY